MRKFEVRRLSSSCCPLLASLQKLIEQEKENNNAANHVVTELVPLWRVCTVCMLSQSGTNLGTPAMIGTSEPTFFLPDWEGIPYSGWIGWLISELEAHDNLLEAFFFFPSVFCAVILTSLCLVSYRSWYVRKYFTLCTRVLKVFGMSSLNPCGEHMLVVSR